MVIDGDGELYTKEAARQLALSANQSGCLFPGKPLYLEVRTWNTRAVRCYEKAGFRIDGEPVHRTTAAGEGMQWFGKRIQKTCSAHSERGTCDLNQTLDQDEKDEDRKDSRCIVFASFPEYPGYLQN